MSMKKLLLIIFLLIISCSSSNKEYKEVISTNTYKITNRIQIARVHFDFNKFNLTRDFIENTILSDLKTNTNILKLYIEGHTDNKGKDCYNYSLGLQRALTVSNIISTNYHSENIILKSFGYSNAIADNRTEYGRYSNRRADIFIDLVEETFEIQTNLIRVDSKNKFNIDLKILLIIILIILLLLILLLVVNKIAALYFIFEKLIKIIIKISTGWNNEIVNAIGSWKEYKIYKGAKLCEKIINNRKVLIKKDIDLDYKDPKTEETNREKMEKGRSPIDSKTGEKIELHHIGQDSDSPFAELLENSEHGDGNDKTLHPNSQDSWRNDPLKEAEYKKQREAHWKERLKQLEQLEMKK